MKLNVSTGIIGTQINMKSNYFRTTYLWPRKHIICMCKNNFFPFRCLHTDFVFEKISITHKYMHPQGDTQSQISNYTYLLFLSPLGILLIVKPPFIFGWTELYTDDPQAKWAVMALILSSIFLQSNIFVLLRQLKGRSGQHQKLCKM